MHRNESSHLIRPNFPALLPVLLAGILALSAFSPILLMAESISANQWRVFAVAYPDDRNVEVTLGGSMRTLTTRGVSTVRWSDGTAAVELKIENLPSPSETGLSGSQYVLWAIDEDSNPTNLGTIPISGKNVEWKIQVPSRIFGLLITAENSAQVTTPSAAVALESLLPINPDLVVPVFRVDVALVAAGS
jgi:hypothetical protein